MPQEDIQTCRAEIDAIDDQLIDLLKKRSAWVRKVGALKNREQQQGSSFIRAGREATMVRRIVTVFSDGSFLPAAAAQLWRIIISASLSLESNLNVIAFASQENARLYWLAREYFGNFNSLQTGTLAQVLDAVSSGNTQVGVLPLPSSAAPWWVDLPESTKVFACIPFILQAETPIEGLAIARTTPEETGDDITLLRICSADTALADTIQLFCQHAPNAAHIMDSATLSNGQYACLLHVEGYHTDSAPFVQKLHTSLRASALAIDVIGGYARPIDILEKE